MEVKNINTELDAHPEGTFLDIVGFNGHALGACSITGVSPVWEMHPDTDEMFMILEGRIEMTLLFDDGPRHIVAPAGTTFVVPKGVWHKPAAPDGARFVYLTPGRTEHSEANDPRAGA